MSRILFPLYGAACYVIFFATFIYMVGFVNDFHFQLGSYYFVPVAIDFGGNTTSAAQRDGAARVQSSLDAHPRAPRG
jgi:hypothetical protein